MNTKSVVVPNRLPEIDNVLARFDEFAKASALPVPIARRARVLLDELLNNIILHGYEEDGEDEIRLQFDSDAASLKLTVIDGGMPFDPLMSPLPDTTMSLEERPIGGLGIFLARSFADAIEYRRVNESNVLSLELRFDGKCSA